VVTSINRTVVKLCTSVRTFINIYSKETVQVFKLDVDNELIAMSKRITSYIDGCTFCKQPVVYKIHVPLFISTCLTVCIFNQTYIGFHKMSIKLDNYK